MDEEKKSKTIRVSINFLKVIEKQRDIIRKATWNKIEASDCEVTDILAEKIMSRGLVT